MDLLTYLRKHRGIRYKMAEQFNVHVNHISNVAYGKPPSKELAEAIQEFTEGAVTVQELRPNDWGAVWPELIERRKKKDRRRQPGRRAEDKS